MKEKDSGCNLQRSRCDFYLVDFDKLTNDTENTMRRIKSDFKWIASNIPKFKKKALYLLL
ncbi:hypothetical protein J4731_08520 [Providencia rettgeri]|nr:hypothetical protein [Providencia rettgeri]